MKFLILVFNKNENMKKGQGFNILLIAIIAILLFSIVSFNYGYSLGERRGYVQGVQKCLEGMEGNNHQIMNVQ
jgi:hypothetical protein